MTDELGAAVRSHRTMISPTRKGTAISGALIRWLLAHDLVDAMILLVVTVVVGQGPRLFPDAGPDIALDRVDSRADSKGVPIQV
jgi:dihydrofolate reductase